MVFGVNLLTVNHSYEMRLFLPVVLIVIAASSLNAQTSATGIPYFQQHVHYTLAAKLIDSTIPVSDHSLLPIPALTGIGSVEYTNNSPDTLRELYFHLYWNLFRSGSYGEKAPNRDHDPDSKYGRGGEDITSLSIRDDGGTHVNVRYEIDNTIMRVWLNAPLAPGATIVVNFEWAGILPNYGIRSTWGWHDNGARNFSTAQWYPQVCVYDNHGWHPDQYIGMGEFYSDYGSFDVTLTLPTRISTVVSTGWLTDASVLSDSVRERLAFARAHPDSIVRIADRSAFQYRALEKNSPTKIWRFHADSVRDFAWCADEAYIWDAVFDNGIMHHALYWDNSRDFWSKEAAKIALLTIQTNSLFAGQYAYPNAFMCETYEGGMEYPGIVFIGPYDNGTDAHYPQNTMMHELGHEWYPMMMGSNETDYGYMDEGFNTFITTFVHEKYFGRWNNAYGPGLGYNDDERTSNYRSALMQQLSGNQEPSKQKADVYYGYHDYAEATYPHTSTVFFMLRYTMGEKAFDDFMHLYYERWRFKHPYPDDIMNAAEDIERVEGDTNRVRARGDLRWFFNEWFEQTWKLDCAIGCFKTDGNTATVTIERKERAVMPLDLVFTFDDGTTEQRWIAVDDWLRTVADERTYTYTFAKHPTKVEINPSRELLDINRLNNSSCWLPKLDVSLVPKIYGDIKPVDKYSVRSAPFIAPLDASFKDGFAAGWTLIGGYLDRNDRMALGVRGKVGTTLTDPLAAVFQYHSVFDLFSPFSDVDVLLTGPGTNALYGFRYVHMINELGSTTPVHIIESGYDLSGDVFGAKAAIVPALNRAYAAYTFHHEAAYNTLNFATQVEEGLGDPRNTYTKIAATVNDRLDLSSNWNAYIRLFGGSMQPIGGAIPTQTQFQLASPSDVDHISDLYGSNFGMGVRDKIRNAAVSGPLVRGYFGDDNNIGRVAIGRAAGSASFELGNRSLFPFNILKAIPYLGTALETCGLTLFADAGVVTNNFNTSTVKSEIKSDAGVGLRWFGFSDRFNRRVGLDLDRMDVQIDFPLYLDKPANGEKNFGFRVVGMVRQNF